ncbi:hypothetical protein ES332_D11G202300v1 [Gossypium tomentosum]|uniref:RanBP2-type domain-containing protein n=2 Tax=Gossypium tomentosum TaxID=34277 RepID=A0A5D2IRL8_GOSTO|nr:hypothetical protein ES332_D11G202300v1 [Gossypium tomentosum]
MGEGREGDWECSGCKNRNYAFRSFCNRCKQPRLLVDTKTPADSKWLPRIGDWICSGCTNNNYASREKCKKCGQPKEIAAMPAIAIPGASLPTYSHYFARALGAVEQKINVGVVGSGAPRRSLPLSSNWSVVGADNCGLQSASKWPLAGNQTSGFPCNQSLSVPKGWRNGDWMCNCGFHNYSSRSQCKNCNASIPRALGTKRLASEEFVHNWDNKRLNSGHGTEQPQLYPGFDQMIEANTDPKSGAYPPYSALNPGAASNWQLPIPFPQLAAAPTLLGKGAKQWRSGDWMCTKCNNHNYASRAQCNRCRTQRDTVAGPVNAA